MICPCQQNIQEGYLKIFHMISGKKVKEALDVLIVSQRANNRKVKREL
jgi:hypothetical protein